MSAISMLSESVKKLLKIALIGAPNAGKSTLLNRLLDNEISCVSNKVHTTRKNILGVYTEEDTQLEFYDAPGLVARKHLIKHHLEPELYTEPLDASAKCDLIAVIVDAANVREQRRLNRGVVNILNQYQNKDSILILNKVDLVQDKTDLIDIGIRLTLGHLQNECTISLDTLKSMSRRELQDLNLLDLAKHSERYQHKEKKPRKLHRFVVDLDADKNRNAPEAAEEVAKGYKNFSRIFSISALQDDGVEELKDYFIETAKPVVSWPHGPEFVSNLSTRNVVHEIIRGKVMDNVDDALPYILHYDYEEFKFDELGSLHLQLTLKCPKKFMAGRVIGEHGTTVFRIIDQARETISKTIGCDVKLIINVE